MGANLDEIELEDKLDSLPHFGLETVEFEAVALEDSLGSARHADVSQDRWDLRGVDGRRRHEDVERDRQKPERSDVELTGLGTTAVGNIQR